MILVAATLVLAQQQSYLSQAIAQPTGNNGWEEYLSAADLVRGEDVWSLMYDTKSVPLTRDKTAITRYGKVCDLVRAGNSKPLTYPWLVTAYQTETFPAFASLKSIGTLFIAESQVHFSEGRPGAGARTILDLLRFGRRIAGKTTVEGLVSIAIQSQAMRALDLGRNRLSLSDAEMLAAEFAKSAKEPSPLVEMYFQELRWFRNNARALILDGMQEIGASEVDVSMKIALAEVDRLEKEWRQMFLREERFWAMPEIQVDDAAAQFALQYIVPSTTGAMVRNLTQLRLAAIHCKIIGYRRKYGDFPSKLADLLVPDALYDRTTGGPYFYARLSSQCYTLYSLGTPETGRIELVYRRQKE